MIMLMRGESLVKDFSKWNNSKAEEVKATEPTPGK
jgi:hypothetical protein